LDWENVAVSWRWLIDARGDRIQVDWPRLIVALVASSVVIAVLGWLLSPAIYLLVLVIGGVAGIALDIRLRRGRNGD
jgi:hypothetical protein